MGEVYRARDTMLNRVVAIKALPDVFAVLGDPPGAEAAPVTVVLNVTSTLER